MAEPVGAAPGVGLAGIARNLGWLLAGKGFGGVLSLVYLALAARMLGAAGFGLFALVVSTAQAVAAFVGFQTWQIVVRYGAAVLGDEAALGRVIGFGILLDVGAALAGCALAVPVVLLLSAHFGWPAATTRDAMGFCLVLLLSIRSTAVGILRLYDRFDYGAAADAATPITRFAGALVVVATGASVHGFLLAWAAAEITTAGAYWLLVARVAARIPSPPWPWHEILRVPAALPGIWAFTWQTNLSMTLAAVGQQYAVVLVGVVIGPIAAGDYRLAYQLSQALVRVAEMTARAAFAEFARAHADPAALGQGRPAMRRLLRRLTNTAIAASAAACLVLLAARPVVRLVAGPGHAGAIPLLRLLGVAAAIDLASVGFEPILVVLARAGRALAVRGLSTVCLVAGLLVLIPAYGAPGVAMATLAASACAALLFGLASTQTLRGRDP